MKLKMTQIANLDGEVLLEALQHGPRQLHVPGLPQQPDPRTLPRHHLPAGPGPSPRRSSICGAPFPFPAGARAPAQQPAAAVPRGGGDAVLAGGGGRGRRFAPVPEVSQEAAHTLEL